MRFYFGFSKKIPIKWIIGAILGILAFFGLTKVHAETLSDIPIEYTSQQYKYSNSWNSISTNFFTLPAGSTLQIRYIGNFSLNADVQSGSFSQPTLFGRVYLCSDKNMTAGWSDTSGVTNVWFYNTKIPCNYYGSTYTGGTLWVGSYTLSPSYTNAIGNFSFILSTYFNSETSVQIYNNVFSFNQFEPNYYESGSYAALVEIIRILSSQNTSNQTIINNQQQIIDSNQNINDSLNDDNTTEAGSSANDFFDDFEVQDTHGISGVITAPIVFLQNLLTYNPNSCSPLSFTLNMSDDNISQSKSLSLPCGSVLWSKAPNSVILIYDTLIWGLLGYRVLIGLNKFFNDTLNPETAKEYYLDL